MDIFGSVQQQEDCDSNYLPKAVVAVVHNSNVDNTVECVESILLSDYANRSIIICDNSSDKSLSEQLVERIKAVTNYSINILTKTDLAQLGDVSINDNNIIRCAQTLGYAAGANLGFILALKDRSTKYVWLLNDDVAVEPSCLKHMIFRSEAVANAGICSSRCIYYHNPDRIQALGSGKFFRWSGRSALIGNMLQANTVVNQSQIEQELDFVFGASMLVSRSFLENVGLMSEEYFIYCEEPDWAMRGRVRWAFLYSHDAVVITREARRSGRGLRLRRRAPLRNSICCRADLFSLASFFRQPSCRCGSLTFCERRERSHWGTLL
jgi:GT2 family glycosyltransferase